MKISFSFKKYSYKILIILFLTSVINAQESIYDTIKVMTYNIHHAEGLNGKINLVKIAATILENDIDIAALQEVDKNVERTDRIDIADSLAKLTHMHYVFGKNIDFQGGDYGNAVLSRFLIRDFDNMHFKMIGNGEQRGLLQVSISVNDQNIKFFNTHLDSRQPDNERFLSTQRIIKIMKSSPDCHVIMCGDFNDIPSSRIFNDLSDYFDDTWTMIGTGAGNTYPSESPEKRIDYIFISRNSGIKPLSIRILKSDASDHLPVIAKILISR